MERSHHFFTVLWTTVCLMAFTDLATAKEERKSTLEYFFKSTDFQNASAITWAHGVNSKRALRAELNGNKNMLEADILMGTIDGGSAPVAIMAHPPDKTSDLTFAEFLSEVIAANSGQNKAKGIKLDFKDIESVEPCLKLLRKQARKIDFPVWLNADVLVGPGNSSTVPVDAERFLNLTQNYAPFATLSLGWTTSYDCENPGQYDETHTNAMSELLNFEPQVPPTFPVRAGLAMESYDNLLNLIAMYPGSTLTVWSAKEDALNATSLKEFLWKVGAKRAYVDLPFNLAIGPRRTCGTEFHSHHDSHEDVDIDPPPPRNGTDGPDPHKNGATLMRSSLLALAVLAICLIWQRVH